VTTEDAGAVERLAYALDACVGWGLSAERLGRAEELLELVPGYPRIGADVAARRLVEHATACTREMQGVAGLRAFSDRRHREDQEARRLLDQPLDGSVLGHALRHLLGLERSTAGESVEVRRYKAIDLLGVNLSAEQLVRNGWEVALMRALASSVVKRIEAEPDYVLEWSQHTHHYDERACPTKDEVFMRLRARKDGVFIFRTWREYTTDLRRGVLSIEAGTGCEGLEVDEDAEGRLAARIRIPELVYDEPHTFSFTVHFHTEAPPAQPWIFGTPKARMSHMILGARFAPQADPSSLWFFEVQTRPEIPSRHTPQSKLEPLAPGHYEHRFEHPAPGTLYGIAWPE
jgi:hypothetical protein